MWFGILTPEPAAVAQTPAGLTIQTYAGLTITGEVGMVYSIECVTNLAETNVWVPLTNLMLAASPYLWMDTGSPATGRRYYRAVAVGEPTTPRVVPIPAGFFMMGSPSNEVDRWAGEGPQTAVTISRGFWMGKYKVTQGQYQAVMGTNPSSFTGDLSRPVEQVGWSDATNYCARLTQRERAAGRIASNSVYRLPTEAEWEYACRAGTSTRFSYGDDVGYTALASYAWYSANSGSSTHPVGQKLPNAWGLYDVHGNLWEWCLDWYGGYSGGSAIDPQGPSTGINRVIRGSPYNAPDRGCRSAVRSQNSGGPGNIFGLRVVLAPGQP
jgi:formylglycine-generating enzyme required for sulfatase activity